MKDVRAAPWSRMLSPLLLVVTLCGACGYQLKAQELLDGDFDRKVASFDPLAVTGLPIATCFGLPVPQLSGR